MQGSNIRITSLRLASPFARAAPISKPSDASGEEDEQDAAPVSQRTAEVQLLDILDPLEEQGTKVLLGDLTPGTAFSDLDAALSRLHENARSEERQHDQAR